MSFDPQTLIGRAIRIKKSDLAELWREAGSYVRPDMMARVTSARFDDGMLQLEVDYSDFEAHNIPLEEALWEERPGVYITLREAGEYAAQSAIFFDEAEYLEQFEVVADLTAEGTRRLIEAFQAQDRHDSYLSFLADHLSRAIEDGYQIEEAPSTAP